MQALCETKSKLKISFSTYSELSAIGDMDGLSGLTVLRSNLLHSLEDILSLGDLSEDGVLSIEMRSRNEAEEELRSVGVGTSVGHGEDAGAGVLEAEVFVSELFSVDGFTTTAVALGEITTLDHEGRNDTVE